MPKDQLLDANGGAVEIRGWAQLGHREDVEISLLEIMIGCNKQTITLNLSCDELVAWCQAHNLDYTDRREQQAKPT